MREIVKGKVEAYVKQLGKGVRIFERQSIFYVIKERFRDRIWLSTKNDVSTLNTVHTK